MHRFLRCILIGEPSIGFSLLLYMCSTMYMDAMPVSFPVQGIVIWNTAIYYVIIIATQKYNTYINEGNLYQLHVCYSTVIHCRVNINCRSRERGTTQTYWWLCLPIKYWRSLNVLPISTNCLGSLVRNLVCIDFRLKSEMVSV